MSIEARKEVLEAVREARTALNRMWQIASHNDLEEDPELERVVAGAIRAANAQLWEVVPVLVRLAEGVEVDE
ncbi:hypothetical protein [Schaalia georgiae]|nr:hypothetical protein [Schaalia georgiae]